jgi:hypothetical protein
MRFWFWFLWAINAVIAAIVLYFFFEGVADGTVSSFNILLWLALLGIVAAEVGGSLWLRSLGQSALAIGLLLLLAIPGFLAALFFLIVLISHPNFH